MTSPISTERLKEILDGCEGVTPGPWTIVRDDGEPHINAPYPIDGHPDAVVSIAFDLREAELAYFMAVQPEVVSALVAEVLAAREALYTRDVEIAFLVGDLGAVMETHGAVHTEEEAFVCAEILKKLKLRLRDAAADRALSGNRRGE